MFSVRACKNAIIEAFKFKDGYETKNYAEIFLGFQGVDIRIQVFRNNSHTTKSISTNDLLDCNNQRPFWVCQFEYYFLLYVKFFINNLLLMQ